MLSYPTLTFSGTVDWVSSTLDPTLHTARIRCRIQNPERLLKPEMYATVSLAIRSAPQVALPKGALVRLGGQTLVFVEKGRTEDGRMRFERRPVSVDEDVTGDFYPVARGVTAGETVVVDGALLLSQVG